MNVSVLQLMMVTMTYQLRYLPAYSITMVGIVIIIADTTTTPNANVSERASLDDVSLTIGA